MPRHEQIRSLQNEQPRVLGDDQRATLLALADDLPRLWNHPSASSETRKRILRAVLKEIIVTVEASRLRLVLHWQGGDHTRLEVAKNRTGQNRWKTDVETVQLVLDLARILPDHSIAHARPKDRAGPNCASATSDRCIESLSIVRANARGGMS